jgi:hypothetical protein
MYLFIYLKYNVYSLLVRYEHCYLSFWTQPMDLIQGTGRAVRASEPHGLPHCECRKR